MSTLPYDDTEAAKGWELRGVTEARAQLWARVYAAEYEKWLAYAAKGAPDAVFSYYRDTAVIRFNGAPCMLDRLLSGRSVKAAERAVVDFDKRFGGRQ